ncbi:MAG: amino acid ABC transporter permease [Eubacteriales bacterium]|nr:amino acid ABC transporter permease [Eubacteriales bacterium]
MNLNYKFMLEDIPVVLKALPVTLELTFISLFFALVVAAIFGIFILKKVPVVYHLVIALNTFIKGIPLIVQLLFCYYALPYILRMFEGFLGYHYDQKHPSYFAFAVVAFAFNYGAYLTDVVVSSYRAVEREQLEAAYSIGMGVWKAHIFIIIPQAVVIALPNLANYFMWLLKATSLASVVNVFELLSTARASTAVNYAILEGYLVAAGIYWIVCIVVERGLLYLNRRMSRYRGEVKAV